MAPVTSSDLNTEVELDSLRAAASMTPEGSPLGRAIALIDTLVSERDEARGTAAAWESATVTATTQLIERTREYNEVITEQEQMTGEHNKLTNTLREIIEGYRPEDEDQEWYRPDLAHKFQVAYWRWLARMPGSDRPGEDIDPMCGHIIPGGAFAAGWRSCRDCLSDQSPEALKAFDQAAAGTREAEADGKDGEGDFCDG
jgi:hypothetical protein